MQALLLYRFMGKSLKTLCTLKLTFSDEKLQFLVIKRVKYLDLVTLRLVIEQNVARVVSSQVFAS